VGSGAQAYLWHFSLLSYGTAPTLSVVTATLEHWCQTPRRCLLSWDAEQETLGIDSWTLERWKDDVFIRPRRKGRLGVWGGRLGVAAC
ncbi:hypothetical protein PIB30_081857, partial [Stylosanthes scabra]|nr:hypothetical protein [Stylosanthes scabra]